MDELEEELQHLTAKLTFVEEITITPEEGKDYIIYDFSKITSITPQQIDLLKKVVSQAIPLFNACNHLITAIEIQEESLEELASNYYSLINNILK